MKSLRESINTPQHPVIFYEIIPPPEKAKLVNIDAYVQCTAELLDSTAITVDGINIPDIRDEQREGTHRVSEYVSKSDAREFAKRLQIASHKSLEIVINRCSVFDDLSNHQWWLQETVNKFDILNFILVGGESSKIKYPGPSVIELANKIHEKYDSRLVCGGIVIPSRSNEVARLLEKGSNGINFFTSQVIYEPYLMKQILKDYDGACRERGILPKRIFLSFAPISSRKDLEFLRWLGVKLPDDVEKILFETDIGIGWRSIKIASAILNSILLFMQEKHIQVPLGLNIEHISRHNFELSKEFIEELGEIYNRFYNTKYNIFD